MTCCGGGRRYGTGAGLQLVTSGDLAMDGPMPTEDGQPPAGAQFKLVDRPDGETLYFATHTAAAMWQREQGGGLLRTV